MSYIKFKGCNSAATTNQTGPRFRDDVTIATIAWNRSIPSGAVAHIAGPAGMT
jgi:hypothetical protein